LLWLLHQVNKGGLQPGRRKKCASNTSSEQPKTDKSEPEEEEANKGQSQMKGGREERDSI